MRTISQEELNKIIENHKHWLMRDCENWMDMRADLSNTILVRVSLSGINLSNAILVCADLRGANLIGTNLSGANMECANLNYANLSGANLSNTNMDCANLSGANLSGAKGIISAIDFLKKYFEFTKDGVIAYKTFAECYDPPENWVLKKGSILTENVNSCRSYACGCGINVAPINWVKLRYNGGDIWKVLIRWEWLVGVIVPYHSDGKIRCERVELIEIVESN